MKNITKAFLLSAGILLSLTACQKGTNTAGEFANEEVKFNAGTGRIATRTAYSGEVTANWERIDWSDSDQILIWSDNAKGRVNENHSCVYGLYDIQTNGTQSVASSLKINEDVLTWGEDENYTFWAIYPATAGTPENERENVIAFSIPATQAAKELKKGETDANGITPFTVVPDMSNAIMLAAATATAGSSVTLPFYPAYTAFEITLKTQSEDITLKSMTLTGVKYTVGGTETLDPVAGTVTAKVNAGPTTNDKGQTIGASTFSDPTESFTTITYTFPDNVEVSATQSATFTIFTLPRSLNGAVLTFNYTVEGSTEVQTQYVRLANNDESKTDILFSACAKHKITGLVMPDSWDFTYLTLDLNVREWEGVNITESNGKGVQATQFAISGAESLRDVKGNDKAYRQCWVFEPGKEVTVSYKIMMPTSGTWSIEALGDTEDFNVTVTSTEGETSVNGNTFSGALSEKGSTYIQITLSSNSTALKTLYFNTYVSDGTTTYSLDSETQLYDMRGHHYFIVNGNASTTWSDLNI